MSKQFPQSSQWLPKPIITWSIKTIIQKICTSTILQKKSDKPRFYTPMKAMVFQYQRKIFKNKWACGVQTYMKVLHSHCYCQHTQVPHHYLPQLAVEVKILLSMQELQIVVQLQPGRRKMLRDLECQMLIITKRISSNFKSYRF